MSYTYLQEQGEESSAESFSDIPQSVLSKLNLTAEKSYSKDNETESYPSSQFGMMSAPLTGSLGAEKLMSSQGVFPVKISQQREREPGSQENEADSGEKWPESLAKFDPNTSSWRTAQCLLFEDLTECLAIFPRWGMMHDGELWELTMSAHLTEENESGFWPTPAATDDHCFCRVTMERKQRGEDRPSGAKIGKCLKWEPRALPYLVAGRIHPNLHEWLMGWPTNWSDCEPVATDKFQSWLQQHGESLEENK